MFPSRIKLSRTSKVRFASKSFRSVASSSKLWRRGMSSALWPGSRRAVGLNEAPVEYVPCLSIFFFVFSFLLSLCYRSCFVPTQVNGERSADDLGLVSYQLNGIMEHVPFQLRECDVRNSPRLGDEVNPPANPLLCNVCVCSRHFLFCRPLLGWIRFGSSETHQGAHWFEYTHLASGPSQQQIWRRRR